MAFPDPTSSDHVVALTKLNDQVLTLQKALAEKEKQLIAKDRIICELKADMGKVDRDARSKFQDAVKRHSEQMAEMQVSVFWNSLFRVSQYLEFRSTVWIGSIPISILNRCKPTLLVFLLRRSVAPCRNRWSPRRTRRQSA